MQLAFFLPANKKDSEISPFLKKIVGLLLLPQSEVSDCFALEFLSNFPNDRRLEKFSDYLQEHCIDADSTFPLLIDPNVLHHHSGPQTPVSYSMPTSLHYFTVRILKFLF